MKRKTRKNLCLLLCLVLCLLPLSGCGETAAADQVERAIAQFGQPVGETWEALGLGEPDYEEGGVLGKEDSAEILGYRFATYVTHFGVSDPENLKPLEEMPTASITYSNYWDGDSSDAAYAARLRDALGKAYGNAQEVDGALALGTLDKNDLASLEAGEEAACQWQYEGNEITLRLYKASEGELLNPTRQGTISLEVSAPRTPQGPHNLEE